VIGPEEGIEAEFLGRAGNRQQRVVTGPLLGLREDP
jgi:hypothetical protein